MTRWLVVGVMLIVMTTGVHAEPHTRDLFRLCPPEERMDLFIDELSEHATKGGLTEAQIRNAAESRLRAAGLYDPDAIPFLYVNVDTGSPKTGSSHFPFFSIRVEYRRALYDLRLPWLDFAATWFTDSVGQGDSSFILFSLSQHLDAFLVEYLRVRDSKACRELRAKDEG